jgi:NADPH:quinone reductase-like Zn-dependent oxidoreductase
MRTIYFEKSIPKILLSKALKTIWPNGIYSRLSPTRSVDLPEQPLFGADWVRVRNRLCGICASDLHLLFLNFDPRVSPGALPGTKTIYLGHELIGEVTATGSNVTTLITHRFPLERIVAPLFARRRTNAAAPSRCS